MPELPEVEVVRRGLAEHALGRTIARLDLHCHRVARRHLPGPGHLSSVVAGARIEGVRRRGKYLWLAMDDAGPAGNQALLLHLGMSGQLLVQPGAAPDEKHLHARFSFADGDPQIRFVDQRTFGGLALAEVDEHGIPEPIQHIAPDPFDAAFDRAAAVRRIRSSRSDIKRVLLDQRVVSGIGNIYADEALWRAGVHGGRSAASLSRPVVRRILDAATEVMAEALAAGGTSFDALYVNVNGASGYFDRSLQAYGQEGRPCSRCGAPIRRVAFMNRSSFYCPKCQPKPRRRL